MRDLSQIDSERRGNEKREHSGCHVCHFGFLQHRLGLSCCQLPEEHTPDKTEREKVKGRSVGEAEVEAGDEASGEPSEVLKGGGSNEV